MTQSQIYVLFCMHASVRPTTGCNRTYRLIPSVRKYYKLVSYNGDPGERRGGHTASVVSGYDNRRALRMASKERA